MFANDLLQRLKAGLVCAAGVCSRQELVSAQQRHFKWTDLKRVIYVALIRLYVSNGHTCSSWTDLKRPLYVALLNLYILNDISNGQT